jgi:hypothetical protein
MFLKKLRSSEGVGLACGADDGWAPGDAPPAELCAVAPVEARRMKAQSIAIRRDFSPVRDFSRISSSLIYPGRINPVVLNARLVDAHYKPVKIN